MNDSKVDPERGDRGPFDADQGTFGQDYNRDREAAMGRDNPSGTVGARPGDSPPPRDPNLPADNGRRAYFDPETGEVHGSGSSAGGGNPGDDLNSDAGGGDGYPLTGRAGTVEQAPDDLGPPHFKE
ncbi:hypothetical protein [Sphingomonas sp. MA1305]|uniref:hypothetical protein n=1 Tax=Sphingomonas sp. MA1305 TaxID=2479204 RepID=UPI001E37BF54|nr:hypothetical protein [Sphingomonas sp. MA1305]